MRVEILSDEPISPNLISGNSGVACAFPLSTMLNDGSVCCIYRQGAEKHSHDGILMIQSSMDLGCTWSEAVPVFDGRLLEPRQTVVSGALCQSQEGRLLAVFGAVEGLPAGVYMFGPEGKKLPRRLFLSRSADNGLSWEPPEVVTLPGLAWPAITSKPFTLPDGEICLPIEYRTSGGVIATAMAFSADSGHRFASPVTVAADPAARLNLCDARFDRLPDGRLISLLWTFLEDNEETIAVHQSFSSDRGRSWTQPESTGTVGQITAPLSLPGGQLIAVSNYRHLPEGIRLWVSFDEGRHWNLDEPIQMWDSDSGRIVGELPEPHRRVTKSEGLWEMLPSFTFGTPDVVALADGSLLMTYYATVNDIIHVRACRFRIHWGE